VSFSFDPSFDPSFESSFDPSFESSSQQSSKPLLGESGFGVSAFGSDRRALIGVVMAAGDAQGMRSTRPKPLHRICGRTLAGQSLETLRLAGINRAVVVVSSGIDRVTKVLQQEVPEDVAVSFVAQPHPLGSADAVAVAVTALDDDFDSVTTSARRRAALGGDIDHDVTDLVILPSDRPLIREETLRRLVEAHVASSHTATLLTVALRDPDGHGVIVRGRANKVEAVVDADVARMHFDWDDAADKECDAGVMIIHLALLAPALRRITRTTGGPAPVSEVISVLVDAGYSVGTVALVDPAEAMGIYDRVHLAEVEAELRRRTNAALMAAGVTMLDPAQTYVDATVQIAPDVTLFPGVMLQGSTSIGAGSEIGLNCRLTDTRVGENVAIEQTVARSARIEDGAVVGPFAVLEPGSHVATGVRTGPFYSA
jgi:bifunctional UDP-N-acetylglucosamine pyrophosphorylase / glucosamine-1-phosphate N-acetyltransferase